MYELDPGPHDWGSSWEGLTQTRPALLPNAGAFREVGSEEPRTQGFWVTTVELLLFPEYSRYSVVPPDPQADRLSALHP